MKEIWSKPSIEVLFVNQDTNDVKYQSPAETSIYGTTSGAIPC